MLAMKKNIDQDFASPSGLSAHFRWMVLIGCVLTLLLGLLRVRHLNEPVPNAASADTTTAEASTAAAGTERPQWFPRSTGSDPALTAEEIVVGKLLQFTRSRRELARLMAKRKGVAVPDEVERFFDTLESGNWAEIEKQFDALGKRSGQYEGGKHALELDPVWCAVLDAYGVAEQVREWPAQKLLDYGNAILDSLRPGMVYVGGTDNGRWVPELLNETSGGEPHIIVTQNAMADGRYVEYMNTLYGDRRATLTEDDSKRVFQNYVADAQKRLEHDQQFPDEPKQVRPGEDLKVVDGKVLVSGQVAVMTINEKLLQALMAKNPDLGFAVQESSPLRGTYADALPLGPLMELGARDGQNEFTSERAAQSLDYWRSKAQEILSDSEAAASKYALKSYSHDTMSAANLLAAHNFTTEAEAAYRLAVRFWPENAAPVGGLADLLARGGREDEARQLIGEFNQKYPDQRKELERFRASGRITGPAPSAKP